MNRRSRNRPSNIELVLGATALSFVSALALAQGDLTLPPQIGGSSAPAAQQHTGSGAASRTTTGNPAATGDLTETGPGGADLATQPKARASTLEEVIVVGSSQWRLPTLPDLGSSWRQAHAREKGAGRIHVGVTSLYDPSESPTASDIFLANREYRRVGFLQLFQVHFGGGRR